MDIKVVSSTKEEIELNLDNVTVAEVLRVYLYQNGAEFAAWKREHPSKPIIFKIKAGNVKKAVSDSISAIKKDCSKIEGLLKK
jgi:DNA-directed RNA polymerase subunit L